MPAEILMHRNTAGDGWTALHVAVAAIAALVSPCAAAYTVSQVDSGRVQRLESHASQMSVDVHDLRARVLQLERPNEPVHPPRNPGRIGGKPVIPWIEPWSGSRPNLGTEIGSAADQTAGSSIDE